MFISKNKMYLSKINHVQHTVLLASSINKITNIRYIYWRIAPWDAASCFRGGPTQKHKTIQTTVHNKHNQTKIDKYRQLSHFPTLSPQPQLTYTCLRTYINTHVPTSRYRHIDIHNDHIHILCTSIFKSIMYILFTHKRTYTCIVHVEFRTQACYTLYNYA